MFRRCLTVGALALIAATGAAQRGYELGEHGARIELGSSWSKRTFDRDLGDDQFLCREKGGFFSSSKQAFMVVMEIEALLENEADFSAVLADMVQLGHSTEVKVQRAADHLRAVRRFETEMNGIKLVYRLELLSADGLSYLLMAWSARSHGEFLDEKMAEVVRGFRFPGPGSEWQRGRRVVERRVSVAGYDLVLSHRPFVLRERPLEGEQLVNLTSPDGNHAIFAFELHRHSPDAVLNDSFEACQDGDEQFVEVSRRDVEIGGGVTCRLLVAKDAAYTYHLLAVPLDEGRYLDVRYLSLGAPETQRRDRELFFERLRLEAAPEVVTLPEVAAEVPRVRLEGHRATLFDRARLVADTTLPQVHDIVPLGAEEWLAVGWSSALRIAPGEAPDTVATLDHWGCSVARWGGRWLVASPQEVVHEVRDGVDLSAEPFTARCITPLGDDLLLLRSAATIPVLGLSSSPQMGGDLLVRRTPAGAEKVIASLADVQGSQLITRPSGDKALLIAGHRPGPDTQAWRSGARCLEVDLGNGAVREMGEWSQLDQIAAADRGWLVTGRPAGAPYGIYRVTAPREIAPVVTGERVLGVELGRGRLVFLSDLLATASEQPFAVFEAPLADIRECGPLCQPFSARLLNEVGKRVVRVEPASAAPDTAAAIERFVDEANSVARELVGASLPSTGPGLDALISEVYDTSKELDPEGRILLAVLTAAVNLEQGAVWVPSGSASWLDWLVGAVPEANAFAVAYTPSGLLVSTLDDAEGAWDPGTSPHAGARGRAVLFGLDAGTLEAKVAAARPDELDRVLGSPRPENVIALCDSMPENVFFRERVYEHLAARGHSGVVEKVARRFAEQPQADLVDVRAWLAAWNIRELTAEQAAELASAALDRVKQHPSDAMLCLILGAAYEKSRPEEPDYARACYQRVLRIQGWGAPADAARERLERLNGR